MFPLSKKYVAIARTPDASDRYALYEDLKASTFKSGWERLESSFIGLGINTWDLEPSWRNV